MHTYLIDNSWKPKKTLNQNCFFRMGFNPLSAAKLLRLSSYLTVLWQAITKGNWWSLIGCKNGHIHFLLHDFCALPLSVGLRITLLCKNYLHNPFLYIFMRLFVCLFSSRVHFWVLIESEVLFCLLKVVLPNLLSSSQFLRTAALSITFPHFFI